MCVHMSEVCVARLVEEGKDVEQFVPFGEREIKGKARAGPAVEQGTRPLQRGDKMSRIGSDQLESGHIGSDRLGRRGREKVCCPAPLSVRNLRTSADPHPP